MNILIVTDIFGKTEHIQYLADSLSGEVLIIDPYNVNMPSIVRGFFDFCSYTRVIR